MPLITYSDVRYGQPLPISAITFVARTNGEGGTQDYRIEMLEAESEWTLEQLTLPDDLGGVQVMAYRLNISAVVMFNDYYDMLPMLDQLSQFGLVNGDPSTISVQLELNPAEMGYYFPTRIMNVGHRFAFPGIQRHSVTWNIGSVEARPRLTIRIMSLLDVQALGNDAFGNAVLKQVGDGWTLD